MSVRAIALPADRHQAGDLVVLGTRGCPLLDQPLLTVSLPVPLTGGVCLNQFADRVAGSKQLGVPGFNGGEEIDAVRRQLPQQRAFGNVAANGLVFPLYELPSRRQVASVDDRLTPLQVGLLFERECLSRPRSPAISGSRSACSTRLASAM